MARMIQHAKKITTILLPSMSVYVAASGISLLAFLGVTLWSWNNAKDNAEKDFRTTIQSDTKSAADLLTGTITTYGEVLRGAAGLFNVDPNLDEESWRLYTQNLQLQQRYPGMQGLAYAQSVPAAELESFLSNNRKATGEPYTVTPGTPRDTYVISRYIEPHTLEQQAYIGYDFSLDKARGKAMRQARDTGAMAVTSLEAQTTNKQAGLAIYIPVYKKDLPVSTITERQAAIQGYVSAEVLINDLVNGMFAENLNDNAAIQLYAGKSADPDQLSYTSSSYDKLIKRPGVIATQELISVSGNDWLLIGYADPGFGSQAQRNLPRTILLGGIALSFAASALLFTVMVTRARSITNEKEKEVQEVKDNLIALASHQLRTPATGVKQFIGMVLEGYAGKVSSDQRAMLERAYDSNERQLQIINQILHVSRADSGRLVLNMRRMNLTKLIQTVAGEQAQVIKDRRQRLILKLPKKDVFLEADEQYMAMAIDNLLSNASKYSHPRTTITIKVTPARGLINITVTDHGVGIAEEDMHLLFQKFSRIHNELSIAAGGNGIGLYLCREIVQLHGGTIEVVSTPDRGSEFAVTLPRKQPKES